MKRKDDFIKWMKNYSELSQSSINKYSGAINTISRELKDSSITDRNLYYVDSAVEIEKLKELYFSINEYIEKDKRGNRMYSRALKYYIEFLKLEGKRDS
ncbi:hypothetical protein ACERII_05470 [Evansella sp. AB-rgal1]|uniref:hypothetical protein n=1 Tax=Evansella sp. AB-rgal1 TaxID=3242696 RepID=UPI00359D1E91